MKKKTFMIVGAGWMGCHLAYSLIQKGHTVKIFEKKKFFMACLEQILIDYIWDIIIQEAIKQEFNQKLVIIGSKRFIQI